MADITQIQVGSTTYDIRDANLTLKANIASPALTGTPTAPTAADGTNTTQIATTQFVHNAFKANDAMVFKGTIGSSGATVTTLPTTHYQGWTYKVATAGSYVGTTCEVGDMIICITDGTSANNAHWTVVQSNIDGAVTGPASATDAHIAVFNGTSGIIIKDSGFTIGKSVPSDAKFTDTTYNNATTTTAGLMSTTDKTKLDGIASGANNYSLPTASSSTKGGIKVGTGLSISNEILSNSGVRNAAQGSSNGTISMNINGTSTDIAVKGLGSAAYTSSTTYVSISGGTMTGQLKTSFKQAVAMGTYCASATTVANLCEELRFSSGTAGSANITEAYTKDGVTVAAKWYNFLWIPHRSGGENGNASGDNCNYGTLYLTGMTGSGFYLLRYSSSAIAELKDIYKDNNTDVNVTNTLANTTKYYITGTSNNSTNTGTQVFDSGIYSTTTSGQLNATTYKINEQVTLQWNSTDQSLDFVFA